MTCVRKYKFWIIFKRIGTRREKQFFISFLLILSIIFGVTSDENCSVSWKLTTVPILFGDDIRLKCTAKGRRECFGSRIFKWIGGPDKEVISFDVQVYDQTKYTVFPKRGHYWLVIKNSTARDIDIPYACHCGFYYSERILKNVSTVHSDDKDKGDQEKIVINHTPGDTGDNGKTADANIIVGSCVGVFVGVFIVILILYVICKGNKKQTGVPLNTKEPKHGQGTLLLNDNTKNSNKDIE